MSRTQYNMDIYNVMSDILERTEQCDVYWENGYTTLCGFKQLLNPSCSTSSGCSHMCPYSFHWDCIIRDCLWHLK